MDDFTTVFIFTDSAKEAFRNIIQTSVCVPILVVMIGIASFISGIKKRKIILSSSNTEVVILVAFLAFFILGIWRMQLQDCLFTALEYHHLSSIYNNQQYRVAEGIVEVLHTQPWAGHDKGDIIKIGEIELEVDHYIATIGYKETIAWGGVLRNGVYARIYHSADGTILRIDIKDHSKVQHFIFLPLILRNAS